MLEKIIKSIDDEIKWSADKNHQKNNEITLEQAEWFIKGLEQAKLIVSKFWNENIIHHIIHQERSNLVVTQEMKDRGISCKGKGFNCHNCKDKNGCVDYVNKDVKPKPPLGLISKNIWLKLRFIAVTEAINTHYEAKLVIPIEWIEEYNELIGLINE